MFNWFKKKQTPGFDYSVVEIDMHSHILPGIDDGAQTVKDSLRLAARFKSLGFRKLIATPHIMADFFRNTPDTINRALDTLRKAFDENNIDLELEAAAEYYLDETLEKKIKSKELLTFGDNKVLFELSYINAPGNLDETISRMKDAGYQPVLAHPERYPYFHNTVEHYLQIRESGCALQLNTIALTGYYGKGSKKIAEALLKHMAIDYLGSDMHHLKHADALADALYVPVLQQYLTENKMNNLLL